MANKSKTKFFAFVVVVLFLAGGVLASYWYVTKPKKITSTDQVSEETKKLTEKKDSESAKSTENKNASQGSQQQSTSSSTAVAVTISSIGQSGDSVYVNALVAGSTSGTCKLTLSSGSTKVEKSAGVGLQVSYYICQGFSVPTSELVPKGEWSALIELSSPNGNTRSEVKKVTVQ